MTEFRIFGRSPSFSERVRRFSEGGGTKEPRAGVSCLIEPPRLDTAATRHTLDLSAQIHLEDRGCCGARKRPRVGTHASNLAQAPTWSRIGSASARVSFARKASDPEDSSRPYPTSRVSVLCDRVLCVQVCERERDGDRQTPRYARLRYVRASFITSRGELYAKLLRTRVSPRY